LAKVASPGVPHRSDVAIASVLGMALVVETVAVGGGWAGTLVAAVPAVALAWRRSLPLLVPLAELALLLLAWRLDRPELVETISQVLVWVLGAFAAGAYLSGRAAVGGWASWVLVSVLWMSAWGEDLADLSFELVLVTAPWVAGVALRRKRDQVEGAEDRAASVAAQAARAVADERARIARELHDVVAHAVGIMVVQAGAASELLERDPVRARRSLDTVQQTGRLAVDELARMLGLLRMEEGASRSPLPSLARLSELLEEARASGTPVTVEYDGDVDGLPSALDATAYRILQEGLTNVAKHAPGATAHVRLSHHSGQLEIDVSNDPATSRATLPGTGHGLLGIGERSVVFGGEVHSGPTDAGGFQLVVRLPVADSLGVGEDA
jgi:signal transduction histidine kinase